MNVNLAAEPGFLRRHPARAVRADDLIVLAFRDQPVAPAAHGVVRRGGLRLWGRWNLLVLGISAVVLVGVVAAEPEGSVCGTDDGETLLLALPVPRSDPDVFFVGPRVYERCPCACP